MRLALTLGQTWILISKAFAVTGCMRAMWTLICVAWDLSSKSPTLWVVISIILYTTHRIYLHLNSNVDRKRERKNQKQNKKSTPTDRESKSILALTHGNWCHRKIESLRKNIVHHVCTIAVSRYFKDYVNIIYSYTIIWHHTLVGFRCAWNNVMDRVPPNWM